MREESKHVHISLSVQGFVTWLYQTFDFLKQLKQLLKIRWNVHSSLLVLCLSRPAISSQHTPLSLSLSLSNQVYLLKHFLFPKAIQISINPKKENNILENIYIYIYIYSCIVIVMYYETMIFLFILIDSLLIVNGCLFEFSLLFFYLCSRPLI